MHFQPVVDADEPWFLRADVHATRSAAAAAGGKYQFFVFLATTLFINSLVEAFFMPNAEEFSELVRTGGLDFALLKPIDTQFLVSLTKVDWSSFSNFVFAGGLLAYSLAKLDYTPHLLEVVLYPIYILCGVTNYVQPDDRPGRHQRVAGPQSNAVRFLVLHHQFRALSDGNLCRPHRPARCGNFSRF